MMSDETDFEDDFDDLGDLDDDFDDDLGDDLGDDLDDDLGEDWDDDYDAMDTTDETAPKKKKGGSGLFLIILIALIGGGAAAYFTGMLPVGPKAQAPQGNAPAQQQTADAGQAIPAPTQQAGIDTPSMPSMPSMNAPAMPAGDMPPMPTAMVMEPDSVPAIDTATPSIEFPKVDVTGESTGGLTPMPDFGAPAAPAVEMPSMDMPVASAPAPAIEMPSFDSASVSAPAIDVPAVETPSMEMPVAPISAPAVPMMDTAPVAPAIEAPVSAVAMSSEDNEALMRKLDAVSNQMDGIVRRIDRIEQDLSDYKDSGADVSALSRELASVKKQLRSGGTVKTTRKAPAMPTASSTKKSTATVSYQAKKWVLKSVAKDTAWIAREGSTDITKVSIGDNVKGLGRVKSIGIENGVWTVRGSHGSVSQ